MFHLIFAVHFDATRLGCVRENAFGKSSHEKNHFATQLHSTTLKRTEKNEMHSLFVLFKALRKISALEKSIAKWIMPRRVDCKKWALNAYLSSPWAALLDSECDKKRQQKANKQQKKCAQTMTTSNESNSENCWLCRQNVLNNKLTKMERWSVETTKKQRTWFALCLHSEKKNGGRNAFNYWRIYLGSVFALRVALIAKRFVCVQLQRR